jgi:tetratricopeptide (TPR) repeat protein
MRLAAVAGTAIMLAACSDSATGVDEPEDMLPAAINNAIRTSDDADRIQVTSQPDANVARSLNALGAVEHDRENLERAESLYVAARDKAEALLAAGRARVELGRQQEAIPLLREALGMMEQTNAGQPSTAQTQSLLGRALVATGSAEEGLILLRTSLAYFEANAQAGSPWLVRTKASLAAGS